MRKCWSRGAEVCDDAFVVSEIDPAALYVGALSGDRVLRIGPGAR